MAEIISNRYGYRSRKRSVTKTANYTLTTADAVVLCDTSGGAFAITLMPASEVTDREFDIKNLGANLLTITPDGSDEIDEEPSLELGIQYTCVTVHSDGTNWWII